MAVTVVGASTALSSLGSTEPLTVNFPGSAAAGDIALLAVSSRAVTDPETTPTGVCQVQTTYNRGSVDTYLTLARPESEQGWQLLRPGVSPFIASGFDGNDGNWGLVFRRVLTADDVTAGSVDVTFGSLVEGTFEDQRILDCSLTSAALVPIWGCAVMGVFRGACFRSWSYSLHDSYYYAYGGSGSGSGATPGNYGYPYAIAAPTPDATPNQGGIAITFLFAENGVSAFPFSASPGGDWTELDQEYSTTGDLGVAGWYQIQNVGSGSGWTPLSDADPVGYAYSNRWTTLSLWLNEFASTPQIPVMGVWPLVATTPVQVPAPGPAVVDPGDRFEVDPIPLPPLEPTAEPPNPPYDAGADEPTRVETDERYRGD